MESGWLIASVNRFRMIHVDDIVLLGPRFGLCSKGKPGGSRLGGFLTGLEW